MSRINLPRSRFIRNPEPHSQSNQVFWREVRGAVHAVNPELTAIIDSLDPAYPLLLTQYDYGFMIANHETDPKPSLVLQNTCELFFDYQDKHPIYRVYQPGDILFADQIFGQNSWFYRNTCWKLTAGCRNVFMLPKITEHQSHTALLRHYEISIKKPTTLNDHWNVFKLIANSNVHDRETNWKAKTLSFGDEWFAHRNDPAWQEFYHYLERTTMRYHEAACQKPWLEMLFGILQHEKNIKIALPHMEQASYLIQMMLGHVPGFTPADDESRLPLNAMTEAYCQYYGIKEYAPIIMVPKYVKDQSMLYYSFNHPTSHLISPETNQRKTLVQNMLVVHWTFNKIRDLILSKKFVLEDSQLYQSLQSCHFDFYHDEAVSYRPFKLPEEIVKDDPNFMKDWPKRYLQSHSHFLNGCVRIQKRVFIG